MCGIIGVTARDGNVVPLVLEGLERLEYRGYDSVGVAVNAGGRILVRKASGKLADVRRRLALDSLVGSTAIGHTRWATHGAPNDVNAHPHEDCDGSIALVHNGVIRNYASLREELASRGHRLRSETDTELIAHLIEEGVKAGLPVIEALAGAISRLDGSYALAILVAGEPGRIYFARMRSPLILGFGEGVNAVASDIPALLHLTRRIMTLEDGEFGWISPDRVEIYRLGAGGYERLKAIEVQARVKTVEWTLEKASKGGYPHFMIKEIYEQPQALQDTYNGAVEAPEVSRAARLIVEAPRVYVVGAGTSYHAGLVFSYYLSRLAGVASIPLISSEFKFYESTVGEGDVVVAVSQSGETYDTLEAVRAYKARGAVVIGVTNVVGSALDRLGDLTLYIRAGPEIGVAATKTFTSQVMVLQLLAIRAAEARGALDPSEAREKAGILAAAPQVASEAIRSSEPLAKLLASRGNWRSIYVLGRGLGYPIAKEGALKIKEIAYLHAEAYPAGESKHGPIALVEDGFPVFLVATSDSPEIAGNALEMAARGADVMVLKPSDMELDLKSSERIRILSMPGGGLLLEPYSLTPFFQLLAYYKAVQSGYDPDKPRNLAKTVTVE
ncbi:MAG: glutamine--fructose-6-phosphate transaminase (isomerizing) [Desulfurococcales archaeon]|nr:glutamine--fructose-6-phosphate transaminase (isomerizing) [Desulfurococcales archaeon]